MKIKLITTKHDTTPEEQYKKFLEELIEFQEAMENYQVAINIETALEVVKEGLDVAKSLQKWWGQPYEYTLSNFEGTSSYYFCFFVDFLFAFQETIECKRNTSPLPVLNSLLYYLVTFSQENNLNFKQILNEHDERLEKRGVKMKNYLDQGDLDMLDNLLYFDSVPDEYKKRLKRMIDEVEK